MRMVSPMPRRRDRHNLKTHTDGDGFSDGAEVEAGIDPLDPLDYPGAIDGLIFPTLSRGRER